jgi:hypothetical protein
MCTKETPPEEYVADKHLLAFVTNAGETPVYKCVVLVGPSKHELQGVMSFEVGTLAPGRTHESYVHLSWLTDETKPTLELTFTDSTGRTWSRLVDGTLKEVAPSKDQ